MDRRVFLFGLLWVLLLTRTVAEADESWALRYSYDRQQVFVEDSDFLDITGPLTVEAWVKADAGIQDKWFDFIVSKNMNGTGYTLLTTGTTVNHFEFGAWEGVESVTKVPIDGWVHAAGVWDDGQAAIYINGHLDAQAPAPTVPAANELPLWIGFSPFGNETGWRGAIDEVRIWAVARTAEEIQWDMWHPLQGNEPGLRAYWNFDEGTGQVLHDLANGNDGRLGESWNPDPYDPVWVPGVPVPEPASLALLALGALLTRRP